MSQSDLREQIGVELASLDMVDTTLREVVVQSKGRDITDIERAAIFSLLIQLYSGFEHIFRRICKFYRLPLPVGDDSHQQLMSRFVGEMRQEEYAILPILIPEHLLPHVTTLRRFRHAAVHGYSHRFDTERLLLAARESPALYADFKKEVEGFLAELHSEKKN